MGELDRYIQKVTSIKTSDVLFNPFNEVCNIHDKKNAPEIRINNLKLLLKTHIDLGTKTIWLFEAPSYLGARRSGAPFVNEGMFEEIERILGVKGNFTKATNTDAKISMTSKMAWQVAKELTLRPLIWESLLFHPHKKNDEMSNRKPTNKEILQYTHLLDDILRLIKPKRLISVGRVAEHSTKIMGINTEYVRHPAQGGYREFKGRMEELYL